MKKSIIYIIIIFFVTCICSCAGTIEKTWTVTEFNKPHKFSINAEEGQTVSSAITYIRGDFTGTLYLSTVEKDSTMRFTKDNLPENGIMADFYGGTFTIFLAKSDAKGEIEIEIEAFYY